MQRQNHKLLGKYNETIDD